VGLLYQVVDGVNKSCTIERSPRGDQFPSVTAASSTKVAPAFSKSRRIASHPVTRFPRVNPASEITHGPWQIAATILPAAAAFWTNQSH
jgi:hypothetical protein